MDDPATPRASNSCDAILSGPFGDPRVPDARSCGGRSWRCASASISTSTCGRRDRCPESPADLEIGVLDVVVVRENTEGEYAGVGGRVHRGRAAEVAIETPCSRRTGAERSFAMRSSTPGRTTAAA